MGGAGKMCFPPLLIEVILGVPRERAAGGTFYQQNMNANRCRTQ
jgi:hypothetical protein